MGFINTEGTLVIPSRTDLVLQPSEKADTSYPMVQGGRILFAKEENNIILYGYLNAEGKEVISAQFLKALPFTSNGHALVMHLAREEMGTNNLIDKPMVRYTTAEAVIDQAGNPVLFLTEPRHILPMKDQLPKKETIQSQFLTETLIAVQQPDQRYRLVQFGEQ